MTFKVGDCVQITTCCLMKIIPVGTKGKVETVRPEYNFPYGVVFDSVEDRNMFGKSLFMKHYELEKV